MKKVNKLFKYFLLLFLIIACEEELRDISFADAIVPPSNISAAYDLTQDNSGDVTITPTADGAISFEVHFGDDTSTPAIVELGGNVMHTYKEGSYNVKIIAVNLKGDKVEHTQPLVVSFRSPENLTVTIENDAATSKQVNISATADFAATYDFYSGETGVSQPVASANIGDAITYQYANPGTYSVKVVAKGAAIATTEYAVDFEVTEILAPIASAPTPPTRNASEVISIYSSVYSDVAETNYFPDWGQGGQGSSWAEFDLNGDKMLQYINLSYQGIALKDGTSIDVSGMEFLHMDVWTSANGDITDLETSLINNDAGNVTEKPVTKSLTAGEWNSIEIPIKDYTDQGLTVSDIFQLKFVGTPWAAGTVFIDNIYFYKPSSASTFNDGLASNGDFEAGSDSWIVGVDDNTPATVVTVSGNSYYSVNVPTAGNPWDVNMSQKTEIVDGNTYTITFDAWSDTNRNIKAGIGLSADPWSSDVKDVAINTTRTTYSVTVLADGWGAVDARMIFDSGHEVGQVNIDNVSLLIGNGNILNNGDFEAGSTSWIVGVDDNAPANVVNTNGNNHYFVDVTNAGNPWDVNMSQKVEIIDGETYTLTFDAWSDVDRAIISGIGLSGDPWSSATESVDITSTRTTYTLTLLADGFGAANARVIFDSGAAVGKVYIDNVSLSKN